MAGNLTDHVADPTAHEQYVRRDTVSARGSLIVALDNGEVTELPLSVAPNYVLTAIPGLVGTGVGGLVWMPAGVQLCAFQQKGDILVATGACTFTRLPVGLNGQILVADSSQPTGLRWEDAPTGTCPYALDFSFECDSGYVALL